MHPALLAAKACGASILWQSLRVDSFVGAIPHVLLVVDKNPCTLGRLLLEGYVQALEAKNAHSVVPQHGNGSVHSAAGAHGISALSLLLQASRGPDASVRCLQPATYSSSVVGHSSVTYDIVPFDPATFMRDVQALQAALRCGNACGDPTVSGTESPAAVQRELLACILIQRHAFQNELEEYRLRLRLFEMGIRVAEHCHLGVMSEDADAAISSALDQLKDELAAGRLEPSELAIAAWFRESGFEGQCLTGELQSYVRACSYDPEVAEAIGKTIAGSIDFYSWSREFPGSPKTTAQLSPPVDFSALESPAVTSVYDARIVSLFSQPAAAAARGPVGATTGSDSDSSATVMPSLSAFEQLPIAGVGAPLRIVCKDGSTLTFSGGMEDCLLNTGYYTAAYDAERNDVAGHRRMFPLLETTGKVAVATATDRGGDCGAAASPLGRLKKREYLKLRNEQRAAAAAAASNGSGASGCGRRPGPRRTNGSDSDDGEQQPIVVFDSCAGCASLAPGSGGARIGSSIGGTFPVGEVICEAFDLGSVSGVCSVFAYPSMSKCITFSKPTNFHMTIEQGIVTSVSDAAPDDFVELLRLVREAEGDCYVRELGIGLNPFVGKSNVVKDVTSFERQLGIHLSLGKRHPLFVKQPSKRNADGTPAEGVPVTGPVLKRREGKFHIDVFLDAATLEMGPLVVDFDRGLRAVATPAGAG